MKWRALIQAGGIGKSFFRSYIVDLRASVQGCGELRRIYDRWKVLREDRSRVGHRGSDPCGCRVDDGTAARGCRWLGWGWDQSWCRRRAWARSLCPRVRSLTSVL